MPSPERDAIQILKAYLDKEGRTYKPSDNKTFDLIVDDKYAEVKGKFKPFNKFDFFSFTENQYEALSKRKQFSVFLVCNVEDDKNWEIIEMPSSVLKKYKPKSETSYYWYKGMLNDMLSSNKVYITNFSLHKSENT